CGSQQIVTSICHSSNQFVGELTTNRGADLGDFLGNDAKTVEAAHERRVESGRNGDGWPWGLGDCALGRPGTRFPKRLRPIFSKHRRASPRRPSPPSPV